MAAAEAPAASGEPNRVVVITALGLTQILAWGSSYYLLAVLAPVVAADTGWPLPWIVGGLSLGLVAAGFVSPRVGRTIERAAADRFWPRARCSSPRDFAAWPPRRPCRSFRGRRGDLVKVIWFDGRGACLFSKRLERGRFVWPSQAQGRVSVTPAQLSSASRGDRLARAAADLASADGGLNPRINSAF